LSPGLGGRGALQGFVAKISVAHAPLRAPLRGAWASPHEVGPSLRVSGEVGSALLVWRFPYAVSTACGPSRPHLKAFSRGEPRIASNRRRPLLSQTCPPLQGLTETSPSARATTAPVLTGARMDCRRPTTLLGFAPLQRLRNQGSVSSGLATPAPFRPQRFARSRRFDPPGPPRACFIPETLLGFRLQGFSLTRIRTPLGAVPLLPFAPVTCG